MSFPGYTAEELQAAYCYPFPCEEGAIYDSFSIAIWLGLNPFTDIAFSADRSSPLNETDQRPLYLVAATALEISTCIDSPGDASLETFVDGLLTSPPVVTTPWPAPGTTIVIGGHTFVIPPKEPPPRPEWENGTVLSRTDLSMIGVRLNAAATRKISSESVEALTSAATRLLEAAQLR